MPIEVMIYSPDEGHFDVPDMYFLEPMDTAFIEDPGQPSDSATKTGTSIACDLDNNGFWMGRANAIFEDGKNTHAELAEQRLFDATKVVIEPLSDGGLAYISYQKKPREYLSIYP